MGAGKSPWVGKGMRCFIFGLRPARARRGSLRPARARRARLRGQPLATLASAVLHDTYSAPGAHPAQEAVHAPAVALLGVERPLDGGPLPGGKSWREPRQCTGGEAVRSG